MDPLVPYGNAMDHVEKIATLFVAIQKKLLAEDWGQQTTPGLPTYKLLQATEGTSTQEERNSKTSSTVCDNKTTKDLETPLSVADGRPEMSCSTTNNVLDVEPGQSNNKGDSNQIKISAVRSNNKKNWKNINRTKEEEKYREDDDDDSEGEMNIDEGHNMTDTDSDKNSEDSIDFYYKIVQDMIDEENNITDDNSSDNERGQNGSYDNMEILGREEIQTSADIDCNNEEEESVGNNSSDDEAKGLMGDDEDENDSEEAVEVFVMKEGYSVSAEGYRIEKTYNKLLAFNSKLLELLECPVCLDSMSAPIVMCSNSHNICPRCREQVTHCPTCRVDIAGTRNRTAEKLAEMVLYQCRNSVTGCTLMVPKKGLERHELQCEFRAFECIPGKMTGCSWIGQCSELAQHMREMHKIYFLQDDYTSWKFDFHSNPGTLCILLSRYDELFLYHEHHDQAKNLVSFCLLYLGPKQNAKLYKYKFALQSRNKTLSVHFCATSHSYIDDMTAIEPGRCLVLGYDMVKCMYASNTVEITKVEEWQNKGELIHCKLQQTDQFNIQENKNDHPSLEE